MIARIGPALMVPTSPKEFSSVFFPPFTFERPRDIARIKGVVRAPVVAPEASKEIARNSSETKMANTKITAYVIVIKRLYGTSLNSLKTPSNIMTPTPMETTYTTSVDPRAAPDADSIWEPRTRRSGSATEIKNPKKKLSKAILVNPFEVAISCDMCSPIGVIDNSTPHKKTDSPINRRTLPIINRIKTSVSTSTIVKQRSTTNITTGIKVRATSFIFSAIKFMLLPPCSLQAPLDIGL